MNDKENPPVRLNLYAPPEKVDRENHVIRGVSATQAVEALGHSFLLDQTTINTIVQLGQEKNKGIKSRFTHPGLSSNGLGKFLGRAHNWQVQGNAAIMDLHLSELAAKAPQGDLREYTETLAEKESDMFGMSIVFNHDLIWMTKEGAIIDARKGDRPKNATTKLPLSRPTALHAVDLVDEPAANRNGLFGNDTNQLSSQMFGQLDYFLDQLGITPTELPALLHTYHTHPEQLPAPLLSIANTAILDHHIDYSPEQLNSFIHRYIQARSVRPFNPISKGDMNMDEETTTTEETAVTLATAAQPQNLIPEQAPQTDEWLNTVRQEAVTMRLSNSGLPQPSIDILARRSYDTPAALDAAIKAKKEELAALTEANVINMGERPFTYSGNITTTTPLEGARNAIDWFFGVDGAEIPKLNMRRFDQLYVALTGDTMFRGAYDQTNVMLSGASPVTLPNMAVDAMNKIVAAQFTRLRYYRWYELIAVVAPNDGSLHDAKWIVYGGTGDLPVVADGAAYTEGQIGDNKETAAFEKRGRFVGITRKMIKNSDIVKIRAVPIALANDSVRTRSAQVASIFTQNSGVGPTLSDGNALFHASRSNVATTAYGTDTTAWQAASEECFGHNEVGGNSKVIGSFAKYNLVPKELYFQALTNFGYGDGNPTTYNPFATPDRSPEDPRPVVLAVPDFTDATDWAYVADPNIWPVVQMTYSQAPGGNAHPQPELFVAPEANAGLMFTNDKMPVKVRDEYAIGVNGGAGVGKRNVA